MSLSCRTDLTAVRETAVGDTSELSVPARHERRRAVESRERGRPGRASGKTWLSRKGNGASIGPLRGVAGIALAVVAWALLDVAGPVRADSKVVEQFLENYLTGCVRQGGTRGHDRLGSYAWCTCAVAQLRMEGSESELEELARRVARGEPIIGQRLFARATNNRGQCDSLGTHDTLSPTRLERTKNFGAFTVALPPGFLLLTRTTSPDRANYTFHRLHEDLRSAATFQVVIARASNDQWSGSDADEFRLRSLLDELGRSRANLRVVDTGETAAGNFRFRRARWQATEAGDPIVGEAYAGSARDTVVLVRIQDQERYAAVTIPAMRASLDTLRLR